MKAKPPKEKQHPLLTDTQEIRRRAPEHMKQDAVTVAYKAD